MYECRCISKHIHLEEYGNVLLGIFDVFLGGRVIVNPDLERKRDASDSSDALSDQFSSLDITVVGRIAAIKRYSARDLVPRSCGG